MLRARIDCTLCTLSSAAIAELAGSFPEISDSLLSHSVQCNYSLCAFLASTTTLFSNADVHLIDAVATKLETIR